MSNSNATPEEPTAMDLLKAAASQFVEGLNEGAVMTTAVLLYEVSELNDDREIQYRVRYAAITDSSMASVYGVINLGGEVFSADCDPKDDDD